MRYHITAKGNPGQCRAKPGNCPLSSDDQHYDTMKAARSKAEEKFEAFSASNPRYVIEKLENDAHVNPVLISWLKAQARWTKNEKTVLALLFNAYRAFDENDQKITNAITNEISSLHFAKEMLSLKETYMLNELEIVKDQWTVKG